MDQFVKGARVILPANEAEEMVEERGVIIEADPENNNGTYTVEVDKESRSEDDHDGIREVTADGMVLEAPEPKAKKEKTKVAKNTAGIKFTVSCEECGVKSGEMIVPNGKIQRLVSKEWLQFHPEHPEVIDPEVIESIVLRQKELDAEEAKKTPEQKKAEKDAAKAERTAAKNREKVAEKAAEGEHDPEAPAGETTEEKAVRLNKKGEPRGSESMTAKNWFSLGYYRAGKGKERKAPEAHPSTGAQATQELIEAWYRGYDSRTKREANKI